MTDFIGPDGRPMIPLRCGSCGKRIGFTKQGALAAFLTLRCATCAADEDAARRVAERRIREAV